MWFPRNTAKVLMQPGAVQGETNGLYAAVLVNTTAQAQTMLKQRDGGTAGTSAKANYRNSLLRQRSPKSLYWQPPRKG